MKSRKPSLVGSVLRIMIPPTMEARLRWRAAIHHRSLNREVIAILERELDNPAVTEMPPPVIGFSVFTGASTVQAIRDARDGKR
ncbi:MAG: Arc family DNA-binding protein [Kiritimatiellia bacterium]|nr:Arc family DNA-binding protein [Kiritimatiellia bacterium]